MEIAIFPLLWEPAYLVMELSVPTSLSHMPWGSVKWPPPCLTAKPHGSVQLCAKLLNWIVFTEE